MQTVVTVRGTEKDGFTWRLVDGEKTVKSGVAATEAEAVVAGQNAQLKYNKSKSWWKA
ncbi:MAG: hypothetical protein JNM20_19310 [Rhizobiales bacterium]|nr:hypothetical protein [Hyphomicrobiales bacterium]